MKMRKKAALLLLLLLVASLTLSGCSLVVKDKVKDAAQIILDVNGETVTKGEYLEKLADQENYLNNYYSYYYQMYQYYGISGYSMPSAEQIHTEALTTVHDETVKDIVLKQKGEELGLNTLTEEETAAAKADAETNFNEMLQQVIDGGYLGETTSEGDALKEEARKYAEENDLGTLESFTENALETAKTNKLRDYAIKDVTVTDEEVQNQYQVNVDDAKKQYEENLSAYGTAVNNGQKAYYTPAGYRYVKQILLKFAADDQTAIDTANTAVTDAEKALTDAQAAVTENDDAQKAEGVTDETKAQLAEARTALDQAVTDAQAALDEAKAKSQQALETAFANLQPRLDEVTAKLAAGEDFDALIEQYNEDPGMQSEPGKTNGYAVCTGYTPFMAEFVDAAMALANVGDVSEPVKNDTYGYHILKYVADIPEGEAGLDAFKDEILSSLLSSKQDETYNAAVESWTNAAKISYFENRLDN